MSRIFLAHSRIDICEALAFRQWLVSEGWSAEDIFVDLLGVGGRWREALRRASERCEAIVLIASPAALAEKECTISVRIAEDMGKAIIVVIAYGLTVKDETLAPYRDQLIIDLSSEPRTVAFAIELQDTRKTVHFSATALAQVKSRLSQLAISPKQERKPAERRKIFISYRRDDSAGHAGRVHDWLEREFGRDLLFMDVDSIGLGESVIKALRQQVNKCDVLLAVIGPSWLGACDEDGQRRLDDPNDFVRIEIATALQRDIPVSPILVDGTRTPKTNQLPEDLRELADRNGIEVRHAAFRKDIATLIDGLKLLLN